MSSKLAAQINNKSGQLDAPRSCDAKISLALPFGSRNSSSSL
jgi:hypothetical protein